MAIRTQQSVSGFIASDPQLTQTENGDARFYARFGQENYRREEDGSFTKLETTFNNLVMYRKTAQRAFERFSKGDKFVAEGYQHEYTVERDGETFQDVEFVAKKIGHDTARTRYEVDRTPRTAPEQGQSRAFEAPTTRPGTDTRGMGL
ncbi:MAG: single-stranded DNA-binding protein [Pseudoclavibacter sp.]